MCSCTCSSCHTLGRLLVCVDRLSGALVVLLLLLLQVWQVALLPRLLLLLLLPALLLLTTNRQSVVVLWLLWWWAGSSGLYPLRLRRLLLLSGLDLWRMVLLLLLW